MEQLTDRLSQMLRIQILPVSGADNDVADQQAVVASSYGRMRPGELERVVRGFLDEQRGFAEVPLPGDDVVLDELLFSRARVWLDTKTEGTVLATEDAARRVLTIMGFPKEVVEGAVNELSWILKAELSEATELQLLPPQERPFKWQNERHGADGTAVLVDLVPVRGARVRRACCGESWRDTVLTPCRCVGSRLGGR